MNEIIRQKMHSTKYKQKKNYEKNIVANKRHILQNLNLILIIANITRSYGNGSCRHVFSGYQALFL